MTEYLKFITGTLTYNLREFFDIFHHKLPQLVRVEQGYCGEIGINTIDKDEIFRIHTYSIQTRVIAVLEDTNFEWLIGKSLSIPLNYPIRFDVNKRKNMFLAEVIRTCQLPVRVSISGVSSEQSLKVDGDLRSFQAGMKIKLVGTYEDKYFLANPILGRGMCARIIAIPVFLPGVELSIITGVKGNLSFQILLQKMSEYARQNKFDKTVGNEDIALYKPVKKGEKNADYTYLPPSSYYESLNDIVTGKAPKIENSAYNVIQPTNQKGNVYDIIPVDLPRSPARPAPFNYIHPSPAMAKTLPKKLVPPKVSTIEEQLKTPRKFGQQKSSSQDDVRKKETPPKLPSRAPLNSKSRTASESYSTSGENLPSVKEISKFSIRELGNWMEKLNLEKYVNVFRDNMVDGPIAQDLDRNVLREDFHMTKLEAIRFLKFVKEGHFPE